LNTDAASTQPEPRRCWISVGSNVEREASIRGALRDLRDVYGRLVISPVYETEAMGFEGDAFYNLVVGIRSKQTVAEIRHTLQTIEEGRGRLRGAERFAPRTIDLDLLTWGDAVGLIDGYELPRDEILKYAFVLAPLADVAPRERHPIDGRRFAELWRDMAPSSTALRRVDLALEG
jgi:2-amino-4-hydroxy-6-hydroxymethyldihydropteridine diphosphokinase